MNQVVIKMLFEGVYFKGPREIIGYIKIDPSVTFDSFVREHMAEVAKMILDMDSVEESFNQYPAFTKQECEDIFENRPENLEVVLSRLEKFKEFQEFARIEVNDKGETIVSMSFGKGIVVEDLRQAMGCLKMDPEMTCEKFIKTRFDYFTRKTLKVDTVKTMFESHPAFTRKDCEREFKDNPEILRATIARLKQYSKQQV